MVFVLFIKPKSKDCVSTMEIEWKDSFCKAEKTRE